MTNIIASPGCVVNLNHLKNKGCLMNFMDDEKVGSINDAL
jgi:hypothetical protein